MMSLAKHLSSAAAVLTLALGLSACSSGASGTPVEELEAIQITAEMTTSELTIEGALSVTGKDRDFSLGVAGSASTVGLHTPGANDLSKLQGKTAKVTVRSSDIIGSRVALVTDDSGVLYASLGNDDGEDNTTFGKGFARLGETLATEEGETFIVEQTTAVFTSDDGDVKVKPGESGALTINGARYRVAVIAAYRVSVNPDADAVPGCMTPDMLSYEILRVEEAPKPEKLTRLSGGASPREGCAFSVD